MKTGTLAAPPQQNPQRPGFRFDGWTLDGQPFDFQAPILKDTTLKAQWTKITDWTLNPDHGPASGARLTISPPSLQEPYYVSVRAADGQLVGLTGDGRIYTWTQDSTPKQVPFPAQAPDGLHYLQATAGSRRQAALGSDQHIYTWTSRQPKPTILDTSRNTQFTSISINDNLLLAVDQQGQVHTYQTSQTGNQNTKPTEQATLSLPGQAQAVTAATSASQALILDADGQAWTWNAATGNSKPERVKQDPGMRIVQAQALSQGFLLLDADGQAWYLSGGMASMTPVSLPGGAQASRIAANEDQAIITGTDGRAWAWQPSQTPKRADDGSRQYVQAVEAGSRITAISRQGDLYGWSLDGQGQAGRPVRIDTNVAPTLEAASMDGQALMLKKTGGVWQTKANAHKPGLAAVLITGRQDGHPFTRSLGYTIDQPLTRDANTEASHTVSFKTDGGDPKPGDQNIPYPYGRVQRPTTDPTCEGYQFDGWFIGEVAYDFSKPVTDNLTLTAHWTSKSASDTWSITPNKGSQLGGQKTTITPPTNTNGIKFNQTSGGKDYNTGFSLAVGSDGNAYAWGDNTYGQLGDGTTTQRTTPVIVKKPAGAPEDFTYVQVSAGGQHSLALGSDGYAYAWGHNDSGQLGNDSIPTGQFNSNARSLVPVRVRDPDSTTDTSKGLKVTQVSAGYNYSLAVGSDGYAYAWGHNGFGQLGNDSIPTGQFNSNARSLVPVRVRDPDSTTDTSKGLKVTQVSAGYNYSLAVGSDGYAYAWGHNGFGQLGNDSIPTGQFNSNARSLVPVRVRDPDSTTDTSKGLKVTQVSAGYNYSLAVGSDGYAYAWGHNGFGQLGNDSIPTGQFNSNARSLVPVRVRDPDSTTDTSKGLKVTQVSAGYNYSLAVGSDGYAYAWGHNGFGQLGNDSIPTGQFNSNARSLVPVRVRDPDSTTDTSKGLKVTQVSAGYNYSLAVGSDGYAYAWGHNGFGQLGNDSIPTGQFNSNARSLVPVRVRDPDSTTDTSKGLKVTQVSAGYNYSLAVGSDGYAYAWGHNGFGQLGNDSIPTGQFNSNARSLVPVRVRDPDSTTDT
ncbi:InlB B-repeat-containing protein, partial [Bifidobacterium sp. wkB338]|uniref:RCC1 domain-containing protein n=1 Tax=Bifidobacterium sp. wkB338 TaxID=2025114 RepID=UPI00217E68C2